MIKWIDTQTIADTKVASFFQLFCDKESKLLIRNVQTQVKILSVDDTWYLPVSINETEWENSYVCSPYTAFVTYAREELRRNVPSYWLRFPLELLLDGCAYWFRKKKINKVIHVNNFLFSTNPYSEWKGAWLPQITTFLTTRYPDHAIVFRSLNAPQHAMLLEEFKRYQYQLCASRQVYLFHPHAQTFSMHRNIKLDKRKIRQQGLRYIPHTQMQTYLKEALLLYNKLYLQKYSPLNPQYTDLFFEEAYRKNMIHFEGYADEQNRLKAFSGMFEWGHTVTSPLVGYDTDAPQKEELYLHAARLVYDRMLQTGYTLNMSSGAASFKRLRGGQPHIEYSALYYRHLPAGRRRLFAVLCFLANRIGIPILKKYKL
jgi:hypothetical protein